MLLQSRPTGEGIGNYCFAIDAEGHISDRRVAETLMGLRRSCLKVRYLGSYPKAEARTEDIRPLPPGTSDAEFVAAADWVARCQDGRF
jgi:prephenate dehydratase